VVPDISAPDSALGLADVDAASACVHEPTLLQTE
jgi:hypothetical protein